MSDDGDGINGGGSPGCAEVGCGCVPPLTGRADTISALRQAIAAEVEPVVTLTHLLRLCRDEHPTLFEHHGDPRCRARVDRIVERVTRVLPESGSESSVSVPARQALADALAANDDIPTVVVAHALAELIDGRYGHSFTDWFRRRSPYQPVAGDPIPLDTPDLRLVTDLPPTAPPWRLANRLDETRRVRLAGAWTTQFRVVFDYAVFDALAGVISADTVLATCHPNRDLGELGLAHRSSGPVFPVQPTDVDAQRRLINALLTQAVDAGATVAVLPELSVTEGLAVELQTWVARPGPLRLLVAGSFHHADTAAPARRANRAMAWVRGHPSPLTHDKHSPADHPVTEDITPRGWPELRIYVTADGWHLVIAVCRDLLNPNAVHALTEVGANLVLAPSMSETLVPFGAPVAQLVGSAQALVAVANNPAHWFDAVGAAGTERGRQPARSIFGHPGFTQQSRQVRSPDDRAGIALLRVRTGQLGWYPLDGANDDRGRRSDGQGQDGSLPAWVARLRRHCPLTPGPTSATIALRPAAILVLLTEGPDGPQALLTARNPDLENYPGRLVFPGGAADPADAGAVETALREAGEEIGLDPTSVEIIGALPSFALPESAFLVTPVLAWSSAPRFVHPPNEAEVASVLTVPLRTRLSNSDPTRSDRYPETFGVMTAAVLDLVTSRLGNAEENA